MNINIYGSTGIIGTNTLKIISKYFPKIKINLLCANNNVSKLITQTFLYKPKYVFLNNSKKINNLKNKIYSKTKILNRNDLIFHLRNTKSDFSILAISGYRSLDYFDLIINNTSSFGLVSKEAIVSAGHLLKNYKKSLIKKIYPLDSEHFSIFKYIDNFKNLKIHKLTLTASGGPFFGKKFSSLDYVTPNQASKHPKWKMGFKNSLDSATLVNKCLELVEAHYLFNIPYEKLDILIHPQSKIHSIFEHNNYIYNMIAFQNDMSIPIFHFLNQKFEFHLDDNKLKLQNNSKFEFFDVNNNEYPIYNYFKEINKSEPSEVIKFNVANEYAVNLFKKKCIKYTDIYKIIVKITSLNLNYKLKNIKDIISFHELLEKKIYEQNTTDF